MGGERQRPNSCCIWLEIYLYRMPLAAPEPTVSGGYGLLPWPCLPPGCTGCASTLHLLKCIRYPPQHMTIPHMWALVGIGGLSCSNSVRRSAQAQHDPPPPPLCWLLFTRILTLWRPFSCWPPNFGCPSLPPTPTLVQQEAHVLPLHKFRHVGISSRMRGPVVGFVLHGCSLMVRIQQRLVLVLAPQ